MQDIWDINPLWFNTFFEWQKTENGLFKVRKRKLDQLPYWQGRFSDDGNYYTLHPVKKEMIQVLTDFAKSFLHLKDSDFLVEKEYINDDIHFRYGDLKYTIGFFEKQKKAYFSKYLFDEKSDESRDMVKKVGNAFNEKMNKGKYQTFFTTY